MTGINAFPLRASVTDAEHSEEELKYEWLVYLHHNDHFHPEFPIEEKESHVSLSPAGCVDEPYWYRIALRVTDAAGLHSIDEVELFPYCGIPPAQDINLQANASENNVSLDWTLSEVDPITAIHIERAVKYGHFERIAALDGNLRQYQDLVPIIGESNYRVKAIREDGIYAYSNIEEVNLLTVKYDEAYRMYPNPASDQLTIHMPETMSPSVEFEVFTASGVEMFRRRWGNPQSNSPLEETVNTSEYIPGIYYFKLTDGERSYHGSFFVSN